MDEVEMEKIWSENTVKENARPLIAQLIELGVDTAMFDQMQKEIQHDLQDVECPHNFSFSL